jgi:phosphoglycolate phosphatase
VACRGEIRCILFDWDGTLLDSFAADSQAYLQMFRALGVDWGETELRRHYSPDWYRVYRAAGIPRARWSEADRLWREAYRHLRVPLLPGARPVLERLAKSFTLALVTSGNRTRVSRQLRLFGLERMFAARVFGDDTYRRKPHPDPLTRALRQLNLQPESCLYVGDSPEDVAMARAAGVRVVAVLGPFPTHDRLRAARPDGLLRSVAELPRWLALHYSRPARSSRSSRNSLFSAPAVR